MVNRFSFLILLIAVSACTKRVAVPTVREKPTLDGMISRMIMIGFREAKVTKKTPVVQAIRNGHVGGVILFSRDQPSNFKLPTRNIVSRKQVTRLCAKLRKVGPPGLLIAVDEEGGRVTRLNKGAGYAVFDSAFNIALANDLDTTRQWARGIAEKVKTSGFNVNFAPVVDLHIERDSGVIGRLKRSFSETPAVVVANASVFIEEQHKAGLLTAIKHFPGHGSAKGDTHAGFVDVTKVWKAEELEPFRLLIAQKSVDMVMTAHVFNSKLDTTHPCTFSKAVITGKLRGELGWDGVVVSDDMHMGAVLKNYSMEKAIELAILAGVDILCFSNNMESPKDKDDNVIQDLYDPQIGEKVFAIIKKLVAEGRIPEARIRESYERISRMTAKIK
ncbi:MAG: glycoside hydrolase family 3 protein [Saprospiraceae bacterium]